MLAQIAFIVGITCCQYLPSLPSREILALPFALLLLGQHTTTPFGRALWLASLAFALGLNYASWRAERRLMDELSPSLEHKVVNLTATVRGLPSTAKQTTRLTIEVDQDQAIKGTHIPSYLVAMDPFKRAWPPGSRWKLRIKLLPRRGTGNPYGKDSELWMWSTGTLGYAHLKQERLRLADAQDYHAYIDQLRSRLLQRARYHLGTTREAGLMIALSLGIQENITSEDWKLISRTGLNHLVAISGLHIGIIASIAALASKFCFRKQLISFIPARVVIALVTILTATGYAVLAGLSIPTRRALFMIIIAASMQVGRHSFTAFQTFWTAFALVLLLDPFAVLTPGLWLSFGLVASLLCISIGRRQLLRGWRFTVITQTTASFVSLTPLALFFGAFPLISPFANALAIPYISLIVTPLSLISIIIPIDSLLSAAAWAAHGFFVALDLLGNAPVFLFATAPGIITLLGFIGTALLIMPRGFPGKPHGIICLIPLVFYSPPSLPIGTFRLTFLDIGQGLSVLIQTAHHVVLYDTGALSADKVVLPQLHGMGIKKLDKLILSHHDLDHDGAAPDIVNALPVNSLLAGQADTWKSTPSAQQCRPGINWSWDGIRFEVLSPEEGTENSSKNAKSCVLRLIGEYHSALFTGDIPATTEHYLVTRYGAQLKSSILISPHHGSKTSSSSRFLEQVAPQWVVISAGYHNRYGHPHREVIERYQARGMQIFRTDLDGSITIEASHPLTVERFREYFARYWRPRKKNEQLSTSFFSKE